MEMSENKLKDILTGQREEFQRHVDKQMDKQRLEFQSHVDTQMVKQREEFQHVVGIMKEDLESKVQLIGEQYQDIRATLNSHTEMLASHSEMIGSLMEDVQIIKSDVQFLKGALKKKVDYEEFEALAQRVSLLESKSRK